MEEQVAETRQLKRRHLLGGGLPQSDFVKAGSWSYSKAFYGAWNQSQDGVGSLSMSESSIGSISRSGAVYSADQLGKLDPAGFRAAAGQGVRRAPERGGQTGRLVHRLDARRHRRDV